MIKDVVIQELNLLKNNDGFDKKFVYDENNIDIARLVEIILSECNYSVTDAQGNFSRYGSSTNIRVIKLLIKLLLTNATEIPPEIVSMALTKENILGPFTKIEFKKTYNENNDMFSFEMEEFFPKEFNVGILKNDEGVREKFVTKILTPYVKEIILESKDLCDRYPIGSFINKKIFEKKDTDKMKEELIEILSEHINIEKKYVSNISEYIVVNIMKNKSFKDELIKRTENVSELQKLGKIHSGFSSMVNSMVCESLQMLELKSFPYGEIASIKSTFHVIIAVLKILSFNLQNCNGESILNYIENINRNYSLSYKNDAENLYRTNNNEVYKYGNPMKVIDSNYIEKSMQNLCFNIVNLIVNKNDMLLDEYINEALKIHYRFLRISPFEYANGRTARCLFNMILKEKDVMAVFRRENRNDYFDSINELNKQLNENEILYLNALAENIDDCKKLEDDNMDFDVPFLLIKL